MEPREQHDGQENRPGGGPVAELVDDEDSQGGYAALVEHEPFKELLKGAVAASEPAVVYDPNGPLVNADYEDEDGRWWRVRVPFGSEGQESMGIPVGPPDLSSLGLPDGVSIRLHNQLFHRGLFAKANLRGRGQEIFAAVQAAYRVDSAAVTALYR